jgi:glycosyltransferase involved in cell wall biosynthesis
MPVFNGERYLASSIQSILDQTYTNFELIIADNASTDRTKDICEEFARKDTRIRYYRHGQNIGAARNYNYLFELAGGEFFRWSNADDLCAPDLHQRCLDALSAHPDAVLSYGLTELIDQDGATLGRHDDNLNLRQDSPSERFSRFFEQYTLTNAIYGLMRASIIGRTGLFGDGSLPGVDVKFMAELTIHGKFVEIPELLFYRRMHSGASSHDSEDENRQAEFWQAKTNPFKMPKLRQNLQLLGSNWSSSVSILEKLRISSYILRRMNWQRSQILAEVKVEFGRRRAVGHECDR